MPKASEVPLIKKTMNFYVGDWEEIGTMYPDMDTSNVIRDLIHAHVEKSKREAPRPDIPMLIEELPE